MATTRQLARDPEVLRLMQEVETLRLELEAMAQRLAEAERLADHDVLTPLLNRRAFVRELQRAIALTRRHKTPASVIYFDLDDFKLINDRYGHAAGDAALVAVAERLTAEVHTTNTNNHNNNDENTDQLQHADVKAASLKAISLARAGSSAPIAFGGNLVAVSVTYGVRQIGAVDSAEEALSEADAAMYLRKPTRA